MVRHVTGHHGKLVPAYCMICACPALTTGRRLCRAAVPGRAMVCRAAHCLPGRAIPQVSGDCCPFSPGGCNQSLTATLRLAQRIACQDASVLGAVDLACWVSQHLLGTAA